MSSGEDEKRKHQRYDFSDAVEFRVDRSNPDVTHEGLIMNISESGLCFYSSFSPRVGQTLTIKTSLKAPEVKAKVIWVKKYNDDLVRVGATFI